MGSDAIVRLTRREGGWRDRARQYRVLVDGEEVGHIGTGETLSLPVTPGRHELELKIDWKGSGPLTLDLSSGATALLVCEPTASASILALFSRRPYIVLRREA